MEVESENASETVSPSNVQLVPGVIDEEIQQVISMFWGQTEALAEQNARLNLQQHIQSTNQNAEQGVHRLAARQQETAAQMEQGVNQLAAHQQAVASQMERMLQDTRRAMNEQIQALAHDQSVKADEQIQNVLLEAVAARQLALQQAAEAQRLENEMSTALTRMRDDLTQRIDAVRASPIPTAPVNLEERFQQLKNEIAAQVQNLTSEIVAKNLVDVERRLSTKGPVSARVKTAVAESVSESELRIQQAMQLALQKHRDEIDARLQQQAPADDASIKERVDEATSAAEQRIEERMRKALRDARANFDTEIGRQAVEQQRSRDELSSRLDHLSSRVSALEAPPTRTPTTTTTSPELATAPATDGDQHSLAIAISDATQKIKRLMEKSARSANAFTKRESRAKKITASTRPVPSARTSTKIAAIVAKLQKDVQARAEAVAKQYEKANVQQA